MAWSLIHAGWMHIVLALINAHEWTMCTSFRINPFLYRPSGGANLLSREHYTLETFLIAQLLSDNGSANCELNRLCHHIFD